MPSNFMFDGIFLVKAIGGKWRMMGFQIGGLGCLINDGNSD